MSGGGIFNKFVEECKFVFARFDGKEDGWKYGMISDVCSHPVLTAYGCCCPCLLNRDLAIHHNPDHGIPALLCSIPWSYAGCCCLETFNVCTFRMQHREATRGQSGISKHDHFTDYVFGSCGCCSMIQEAKQNKECGSAPKQEPLMAL